MGKDENDTKFLRAFGRYLCEWRCALPKLILDSEKSTVFMHVRASVAIYGSILFWLGSWSLLTEPIPYSTSDPSSTFELLQDGLSREVSYFLMGIVLLFLTDTLYGNAGLTGGYYPPAMMCVSTWSTLPRAVIGLLGSGV
jgi:hypothetical protein